MTSPTGKPFTVREITSKIKDLLEGTIRNVEVTGETCNIRANSTSPHLYFALKDASAQINCVMYASQRRQLSFMPQNGMKVTIYGAVTFYQPSGSCQILVSRMTNEGQGSLMAKFEEMKNKLKAEGLFDQAHKRPLPSFPRHIGIVTAPGGAAIRDMLNILGRRYPNLDILIAPAKVQGDGAAAEIANGIRLLNGVGSTILPEEPKREVIIVTRGGGSIEDLWQFNEEAVARAVYASEIPVISAVGHEIDFTICDFTADYRAPTPSAAAEVVIREKSDLKNDVAVLTSKLNSAIDHSVADCRAKIDAISKNRVFAEPAHVIATYRQDIDRHFTRIESRLLDTLHSFRTRTDRASSAIAIERTRRIPQLKNTLDRYSERMVNALQRETERRRTQIQHAGDRIATLPDGKIELLRRSLDTATRQLNALNPSAVLERGYSITLLDSGKALRRPEEAPAGTRLTTRLAAGAEVVSFAGEDAASVRHTAPVPRKSKRKQEDNTAELGLELF